MARAALILGMAVAALVLGLAVALAVWQNLRPLVLALVRRWLARLERPEDPDVGDKLAQVFWWAFFVAGVLVVAGLVLLVVE